MTRDTFKAKGEHVTTQPFDNKLVLKREWFVEDKFDEVLDKLQLGGWVNVKEVSLRAQDVSIIPSVERDWTKDLEKDTS